MQRFHRLAMGVLVTLGLAAVAVPAGATGSTSGGPRPFVGPAAISENFDTLASATTDSTVVPVGVLIDEQGTSGFANGAYNGNDGSSNAGNVFSYGATGNPERALGSLSSGTNVAAIGVLLRNDTSQVLTGLDVTYRREHWRRGGTGRADRLDAAYATGTSTLTAGAYTDIDALDAVGPAGSTLNALNGNDAANQATVTGQITALSVPPGGTVVLRWASFDAAGADDGIAIDDLVLTPVLGAVSSAPIVPTCPPALNASSGTAANVAVSAADADGTVTGVSITSAAVPGISVDNVVPAASPGAALTATLVAGASTATGTYAVTLQFTNNDAVPQTTTCAVTVTVTGTTRIHAIQGPGATSPLAGQTVTIEGVVIGVDDEVGASFGSGNSIVTFTNDRGLFVQEEATDVDANPATSEGIFVGDVFTVSNYPVGTRVRVTGVVRDGPNAPSFDQTKLLATAAPINLGTAPVPAPVVIDTVLANAQTSTKAYYESLEGMLVRLEQGTAQSGGTNKFGELFLVPGDLPADPLRRTDPVQPGLIATMEDAGSGNPPNPFRPPAPSTSVVLADAFALVEGVQGPLAYTFSNFKIAVQPGALPTVTNRLPFPFPGLAAPAPGDMRIASFNVENFFPVGGALDGGTVSAAEFDEKRNRLADAIGLRLGAPDIVAVQEVADLATLQALATQLGASGYGTYTAHLVEGNDTRGIDVGFLVKSTVTINSVTQYGKTAPNPTVEVCSDVAGRLFDRPPLALDTTAPGIGRFVVFSNHFSSKAAPDACRDAQAAFVRTQAATLEAGGVPVIVTGDLNAFEDETPLAQMQAGPATLTNLWPQVSGQDAYSFQFNGLLQTLDHMLVSDGLDPFVSAITYAHIDTDYFERGDGHKVSDHNPPVLVLNPNPGPDPVVPEAPVAVLLPLTGMALVAGWLALQRRRAFAALGA